jgi:uncharacterized phiE125 gp8 family phage protein
MTYSRRTVKVKTAAAALPVTLTELKNFLRIDGTADDSLLSSFLSAATDAAERYCNRYFINTTLELRMDSFPAPDGDAYFRSHTAEIDLPCRPASSVVAIKTYSEDNTESTVSASDYRLDGTGARVSLNEGYSWPTNLRDREAILVEFVAGYGASASDVPAAVKTAIQMHAGRLFECRGECEMTGACKTLLDGYRLLDRRGWE